MTNIVLLNKEEHKNLKIIAEKSPKCGDDVMFSPTFPLEFRSIQAHYPILFRKDSDTGQFYAAALFGFEQNENLFLDENGWNASYIPLMVERQPFSIGIQNKSDGNQEDPTRVMHIDLDSPKVSETEGEPLFLDYGGNSEYLDRTASMLETIHHWNEDAKNFIDVLFEFELLEAVTLDITLEGGAKGQLLGFYTINEEKLNNLDSKSVDRLFSSNHLQAIYMVMASLSNVRKLMDKKSQKENTLTDTF